MSRVGSLFSGYGGLDLAVKSVWPEAETAWVSDVCKIDKKGNVGHHEPHRAPCSILAHHWPDVPNHGDITKINFRKVEPVEILTGGFPCQDVSHAGRRAGLGPGTRTGLWSHMARAIDELRPSLVVAENVRGLLSAKADSDMEPCPWCVGDPDTPDMRALGAVLADLADLGYDAAWHGLRAADVGAPHGRFRVFIAAWPAADADSLGLEWGGAARDGWTGLANGSLLPTPRATDRTRGGPNQRGSSGDLMLPSAVTLLQTPSVADALGGHLSRSGERGTELLLPGQAKAMHGQDWGIYADAIARWEALTRPAPAPTQLSKKGTPQLSPAFSEWLMGLPAGHVTDVPGLSRNDQLKALGNGVVPAQAAEAIRRLLPIIQTEVAA